MSNKIVAIRVNYYIAYAVYTFVVELQLKIVVSFFIVSV